MQDRKFEIVIHYENETVDEIDVEAATAAHAIFDALGRPETGTAITMIEVA